jgi:hypothetical protein
MSPKEREEIQQLRDRLAAAETHRARAEKALAALVRKGVLAPDDVDEQPTEKPDAPAA